MSMSLFLGCLSILWPDAGIVARNGQFCQHVQGRTLTRILFAERMLSTQADGTRSMKFYGAIEVHHLDTADADAPVELAKPGKNGFNMRCDMLTALTSSGKGKVSLVIEGRGHVTFHSDGFVGVCESIKCDLDGSTFTFDGSPTSPAAVRQARGPSGAPRVLSGQRIVYHRETGEFKVAGTR